MKKTASLALALILAGTSPISAAAHEDPDMEPSQTVMTAPIWSEESERTIPGDPDGVVPPDGPGWEEADPVMAWNGYVEGTWTPYEGADYALKYSIYDSKATIMECIGNADSTDWGDLVIPDEVEGVPVTRIIYGVFQDCTAFKGSLRLPENLESIYDSAFFGCTGLTGTLALPETVTLIGNYAFYGCTGLTGMLTLPENLSVIGGRAFYECSGFTGNLTLPEGIRTIESGAFLRCGGFTGLTLPESLESIGDSAFAFCEGIAGSLTLPGNLKAIGESSFYRCCNLTEVIIPDGVTEIGMNAFEECDSLINISIPASVTGIGMGAFYMCNGLTHVYYGGSREQWDAALDREYGCEHIDAAAIHYGTYHTSDTMPPAFAADVPSRVMAPAASAAPVESFNRDKHIYNTWHHTVESYLYDNGSGLTRVEYTGGNVIIEQYDYSFQFKSGGTIAPELPIWGGFFAGEEYNFLIFGQANPNEDDSVEVIRVVKYDKDWNRLGHASLRGANTTLPFEAGSLRCDEYGGMLYVRTCHQMYTSKDDGSRHQANLTLSVRMADMKITDWLYDVRNVNYGYISHSFNQFILTDAEGNLVAFDHGDAWPRSALLTRYVTKAGRNGFLKDGIKEPMQNEDGSPSDTGFYYSSTILASIRDFPGGSGENNTGASLGGLAETASGYVTVYNFSESRQNGVRDIYISYVPKDSFSQGKIVVDFSQGDAREWSSPAARGTTPVLAPAGLNGGYVLWNDPDGGGVRYVRYDARGGVSEVRACAGATLSGCQPIYCRGKAIWYTTDGSAPIFYMLDESGISAYDTSDSGQSGPEMQDPEQVRSFVSRMYTVALGRDAEEAGLNDWTSRLLSHEVDGAGIANGFIMSDEFGNKGLSDEDYVDTLYRTFFDREADGEGKADWTQALANGNSRGYVLAGFVNSVEFDSLCLGFGITRGSMANDEKAIGPGVRQFVNRCYVKVLGREGEKTGVDDWTSRIARGEQTPESVARLFFFSDEYQNKHTGDGEFVETLYQTFMDRASDPEGKADWVGRLAGGMSREEVLEGFSRSEEFAGIMESFGL